MPYDVHDNYWRDVHGPLCARLPDLGWYVQHHFAPEHAGPLWPLPEGVASTGDQARFREASPLLFSDEQDIFDESVAYNLPNGSKTFLDRTDDAVPNGPATLELLHVHFHAAQGQELGFTEALNAFVKDRAGLRRRDEGASSPT